MADLSVIRRSRTLYQNALHMSDLSTM